MHIGIDGRYIQNQYQSVGYYIYKVTCALATNYTQHSFCIFYNPSYENTRFDLDFLREIDNVQLVRTSLPLFSPQQQIGWPRLLTQHKIDLFHTPFFDAPWFAPCPVLITIHDLLFDRHPQLTSRSYLRPIYHLFAQIALQRATHILTLSERTKQAIVDLYSIPPYDITVTPTIIATQPRQISQSTAEEVADGLSTILTDHSYQQSLKKQTLVQIHQVHWSHTADLTMQAYEAIFDVNTFMQQWPAQGWQILFE